MNDEPLTEGCWHGRRMDAVLRYAAISVRGASFVVRQKVR
jgi:hypothetical protein